MQTIELNYKGSLYKSGTLYQEAWGKLTTQTTEMMNLKGSLCKSGTTYQEAWRKLMTQTKELNLKESLCKSGTTYQEAWRVLMMHPATIKGCRVLKTLILTYFSILMSWVERPFKMLDRQQKIYRFSNLLL